MIFLNMPIVAALQSVVRLAPVIDALQVEQPVLRVRHLGEGRYDVDDLIARWSERPRGGETPSFGLFNLSLTGGELQLDDAPAKAVHQLRDLAVSVMEFAIEVRNRKHLADVIRRIRRLGVVHGVQRV